MSDQTNKTQHRLTKRFVEAADLAPKPYFLFDDAISGFSVCISPKGKRHYCFQYYKNKKTKRIWLGQHGPMTAEQARAAALAYRAEYQAGGDPHKKKVDKEREPLVRDLVKRFIDEHVNIHCKASTQKEYVRHLNKRIVPFIGNLKISELSHSDIAALHQSLYSTPYDANRCLETLSKFCNLAEKWGLRTINSNPCTHVQKFSEKARERYLSEEEVKRLAKALEEIKQYPGENLAATHCIQLLLFTGCRLSEIQTLKWEYIDYEKKLLRLPDSKTGAKIVYAGNIVMNLLAEIKRNPNRPKDNQYVIYGKKPGTYLQEIQKPWRRFRKLAGLNDARIHDLRHSFASFIVNEGTSLAMIGKLLGHSQVQTTERYSHIMAEPLIATAERITSRLGRIFNMETSEETSQIQEQHDPSFTVIEGTTIKAPVYLTSDQAAKYLNVAPRLMENWRWRKTGPSFVKIGKRINYRLDALKEFVENQTKTPSNEQCELL